MVPWWCGYWTCPLLGGLARLCVTLLGRFAPRGFVPEEAMRRVGPDALLREGGELSDSRVAVTSWYFPQLPTSGSMSSISRSDVLRGHARRGPLVPTLSNFRLGASLTMELSGRRSSRRTSLGSSDSL